MDVQPSVCLTFVNDKFLFLKREDWKWHGIPEPMNLATTCTIGTV